MLFFLFGKDTFRSGEKVRQLKEKFLSQNSSGSGLSILDYEEKEVQPFAEALGASGLFSSKQLVIAANCILTAPTDTQKQILKTLEAKKNLAEDKDVVVVFWEKGEPRKNNALYKFLLTKAKKENFETLESKNLEKWILSSLAQKNPQAQIEPAALQLLAAGANGNLALLSKELEKLVAYKQIETIKKDDVLLLVKSQATLTIFDTIEALTSGNKKRALELLHAQIAQGEDPFYILSMYAYQIRNLLKIGDAFWSGNTNQYAIAKEVGLHPYVVQKGLAQIKNLNLEKLKAIYSKLQHIDENAKTGKTNLLLALDIFIASL